MYKYKQCMRLGDLLKPHDDHRFSFWIKKSNVCRAKYVLMLCQQTKVEDRAEVLIIGVATSEKLNQLEVLLDDGQSLFIDSELWNPFDKELGGSGHGYCSN